MKKIRLDVHLVRSGLSRSREQARREIMAGWVRVEGETVTDPSKTIMGNEGVTVARPRGLYVSRGGGKLKHALDRFGISLEGRVAVDLGASTGGFTDCMLREGAVKVYAVDVGYGQLDYSLRIDPRVVVMERTNARHLDGGRFSEKVEFLAADLSFISILKVFEVIRDLFAPVEGVILLKPQFEAGPGRHDRGVVRAREDHVEILERVIGSLADMGMKMRGLVPSPIRGPRGNVEFLLHFECGGAAARPDGRNADIPGAVMRAVEEAHGADGGIEGAPRLS